MYQGECSMTEGSIVKRERKVLKSQRCELVLRVLNYFKEENLNDGPLILIVKVLERTSAATNISKRTLDRINKGKNLMKNENDLRFKTPDKVLSRKQPKSTLDSSQEVAIRRCIYSYYQKKEYPTVKRLLVALKEAKLFNISTFTLRIILKRIGFNWKQNKKLLLERPDLVSLRGGFIRDILGVPFEDVIWLDETWINSGLSKAHAWTDDTSSGKMIVPIGNSTWIVLVHAGSCEGFVPNAKLLFKVEKYTGNCQEEIDHEIFMKWFTDQLLPNIKPKRTIVMDSASYHSVLKEKYPTVNWRKEDTIKWISSKNIPFDESMYKGELLEIVKFHKPTFPPYEIDEIAKKHGHNVLRVPPYHSNFNPIELIWAQIKEYVAENNTSFKTSDVLQLTEDKTNAITPEEWAVAVNRTRNIIQEQAELEGIIEERVEETIMSLASTNCDSDESTDDDEEMDESL
ncbi:uncharacterized protein [Halyomorpha halys]|uniref:uncharacterized protein n=1 Tax=Halyomorpha halys TaxID=286706 RepID=UPI0034D263A2